MSGTPNQRVRVDGKCFRLAGAKFFVKGVTYGPFAPDASGLPFAGPEQTARDFTQLRELGANTVRVYAVPPKWLLDLAETSGLKLLVDIPWNQHVCFLDTGGEQEAARRAVREAVASCAGHPAVLAYSVANEIPPDVVRWSGAGRVATFIDQLAADARAVDPGCLCTFGNFPPTEFLQPLGVDFLTFNVYLHHRQPFENYLARLQMLADGRPLLLGEFGMDARSEGEAARCEFFRWQIESAFRGGVAGAVVFSFTDDWHRGGQQVEGWELGLTTRSREPKPAFAVVREQFAQAPHFPLRRTPKVSVVVASYNGDATLRACLESLTHLNYPDYEVVLVDDGSTDSTPAIAAQFPTVRQFRHEKNLGLSVARNTGIAAASGEIIAFTDSDCRADEDWLRYLVADLLDSECAGMGGHNLPPPEDSPVAACVMASPGGPAHVMLTDRLAEHVPGCNMAFYKWALEELRGFDPIFRKAGDDVDICWRLQQAGRKLGFSPAGFVWHYRRATARAYLKQQAGYGEAEALLVNKHPEYFNAIGGSMWRGRIYTPSKFGVFLRRPFIYHGAFGGGWFQTLYAGEPSAALMLTTTIEHWVLLVLPLWVLSANLHFLIPVAIAATLSPMLVCVLAAAQATLPPDKQRWWSRPLIAWLYLLQPVVRGWARYRGRFRLHPALATAPENLDSVSLRDSTERLDVAHYWCQKRSSRLELVGAILQRLDQCGWPNRPDLGWSEFDVEVQGSRWCTVQLATVAEEHSAGAQLLRIRLHARWSLTARTMFWGSLGAELALLGVLWGPSVAAALALLTAGALAWFLRGQARKMQSLLIVMLDQLAKEHGLVKVRWDEAKARLVPA
jgi:glycosyltransferase involved in cell wall biosynthesis